MDKEEAYENFQQQASEVLTKLQKVNAIKKKISPIKESEEMRKIITEVVKLESNLRIYALNGINFPGEFMVSSDEEETTMNIATAATNRLEEPIRRTIAESIEESVKNMQRHEEKNEANTETVYETTESAGKNIREATAEEKEIYRSKGEDKTIAVKPKEASTSKAALNIQGKYNAWQRRKPTGRQVKIRLSNKQLEYNPADGNRKYVEFGLLPTPSRPPLMPLPPTYMQPWNISPALFMPRMPQLNMQLFFNAPIPTRQQDSTSEMDFNAINMPQQQQPPWEQQHEPPYQ